MPSDPRPRRHLWAGPRDHSTEHDWLEPDPEPTRVQQPLHAPAPAPPRASRKKPVAIVLASLALLFGGLGTAAVLQNGSDSSDRATVTLPVVNGATQETRAGQIYRQVQEGVVQLRTGDASGTGFVVDKNGTIVTNAHVVDTASTVRVVFDDGEKSVEAKVLGRDVSSDLAVVKVDPADMPAKAVALALADSDNVKTGDEVLAIGYPLGLDRTATSGIISGLGRQIKAQNGFSIDKVLQTDANINPGNSGGPLLDAKGRVIGVNSQIAATAAGGNTGIGFAIPSNTVRNIVPTLVSGKAVDHPYLGVSLAETEDDSGAIIGDVTAGGPGASAGLKPASGTDSSTGAPTGGDKVTAIDGKTITSPDQLISELNTKSVGDTITLSVTRDGQPTEIKVKVGARPANAAASASTSGTPTPTTPSPDEQGGSGQAPDEQNPFNQVP